MTLRTTIGDALDDNGKRDLSLSGDINFLLTGQTFFDEHYFFDTFVFFPSPVVVSINWVLNETMWAKAFVFLIIPLISSPCFAEKQTEVEIKGDLLVPENYEKKKQLFQQRDQVIPMEASSATSPHGFGNQILEYHFQGFIEHNQFKPLSGLKNMEESVNRSTQVDSSFVKIKSKIDVKNLRARLDVESFLDAAFWSEDKFKTFRAQLKLFSENSHMISLENRSDSQETKTYLNIQRRW